MDRELSFLKYFLFMKCLFQYLYLLNWTFDILINGHHDKNRRWVKINKLDLTVAIKVLTISIWNLTQTNNFVLYHSYQKYQELYYKREITFCNKMSQGLKLLLLHHPNIFCRYYMIKMLCNWYIIAKTLDCIIKSISPGLKTCLVKSGCVNANWYLVDKSFLS